MYRLGKIVLFAVVLITLTAWADNRKNEPPNANQPIQAWEVGDCWFVYNFICLQNNIDGKFKWEVNESNFLHVVGKEAVGKLECFKVHVYSLGKKEPGTFYYRCDNLGVIGPEEMPSTTYKAERCSVENIQLGIPPIVNSTIAQTLQKKEEKIGRETFVYVEHPTDKNRLFVKSPIAGKTYKYYEYIAGAKFYNKTIFVGDDKLMGDLCVTEKYSKIEPSKIDDEIERWKKQFKQDRASLYTLPELVTKYDLAKILKVANINVPDENKGHGNDADHHDEDNPGKGDDKKHDKDKDDNDGEKGLDKNKKESEPAKENKK